MHGLTALELCSGGGGQALGLEHAGYEHLAAVENDRWCCETLRTNRPSWNPQEIDLALFSGLPYQGADLLAAGLPCPPFSIAGKQLGKRDERDLFPVALSIIDEVSPRAVMIENVRGFASAKFESYRAHVERQLKKLGFRTTARLLNASDFGVPQLRPRYVMVGLRPGAFDRFKWPTSGSHPPAPTVGEALLPLMSARGWPGAAAWAGRADRIAPTLVGGSKKHGGPDLGPTRAKRAWAELAVDGRGLANDAPGPEFPVDGAPRITVPMAALLQGFPPEWHFCGGKTAAYRQVGNAFPPPVARAVGEAIASALGARSEVGRVAV